MMSDYVIEKPCPLCGSSPLIDPTDNTRCCCNPSCPLSKTISTFGQWDNRSPEEAKHTGHWKIRISDSFCEYEFYLQGGKDYCIDDLLQIILVHTRMRVVDERLVEPNEEATN